MKNRKIWVMILTLLLAGSLTGCGQNGTGQESGDETETDSEPSVHATVSTVTLTEGKYSEEKLDDTWDEERAVYLTLEDNGISITERAEMSGSDSKGNASESNIFSNADDIGNLADSLEIAENTVTITREGTYVFSGSMEDGRILVDADKDEVIRLVFNGISLKCSNSAPVYSRGGNVIIILVDGTENTIEDGSLYVYEEESENEPDAAIFAKDDLTFNGTGSLNVTGNYNHGIHCKDALKFVTGTYVISAADDGIVGKDSVSVKNGNFTIESGDDGIKATNIDETDKGYVLIEDGFFQITAGGDGIQAETLLRVNDGNMDIVTGGGCQNARRVSGVPEGMTGGGQDMREGMKPLERPTDDQKKSDRAGAMKQPEQSEDRTAPPEGMPQGASEESMTPPEGMPQGTPEEDMTPPEGMPQGVPEEGNPPEGEAPQDKENPEDRSTSQGAEEAASDSVSTKALKSYVDLIIAGGEFGIDSCDDAIHSNQNVVIDGGTFTIQTGDDGVHAEQKLTVNNGMMNIQQSYEGLEGADITVNSGDIRITASDDGINAASDDDSASNPEEASGDKQPGQTDIGAGRKAEAGFPDDRKGGVMAGEDQGAVMTFNGGTVYVNAGGDGLDANGEICINGGKITVHGPENGGNGTLDYASACKITAGTLIGAGSVGMAQNPSEDSTQPVIVWSMDEAAEAGTVITVKDGNGTKIAEITTEKKVQWFVFSSEELAIGENYTVCAGDTEKQVELEQIITQIGDRRSGDF